jgi:hypothetical protein
MIAYWNKVSLASSYLVGVRLRVNEGPVRIYGAGSVHSVWILAINVSYQGNNSGGRDFWIVKELHGRFLIPLCLREECGILDPFGGFLSAANIVKPVQGWVAVARCRHGLEGEDEGYLKTFIVICISYGALYCHMFGSVLFTHKKRITLFNFVSLCVFWDSFCKF